MSAENIEVVRHIHEAWNAGESPHSEQVHRLVPALRSIAASKRTLPQ